MRYISFTNNLKDKCLFGSFFYYRRETQFSFQFLDSPCEKLRSCDAPGLSIPPQVRGNFRRKQNSKSNRKVPLASSESIAKVAREVQNTLRKSTGLLQTDYTIDAKSNLGLLPDRKLPRYGSLPRRPRQLEGREMSHDVLEDSDYPRASPNVSNPILSEALTPKTASAFFH